MKILSCTASRAEYYNELGLREPLEVLGSVPSGEKIRILLDTGQPDPAYMVREYGGIHTWEVEPRRSKLALAMDSTIVRHLFNRSQKPLERDPYTSQLDELVQEPTIADSLFNRSQGAGRMYHQEPSGVEVCYRVPGDLDA